MYSRTLHAYKDAKIDTSPSWASANQIFIEICEETKRKQKSQKISTQ